MTSTNIVQPGLSFQTLEQPDKPLRMALMPNLNMSIPGFRQSSLTGPANSLGAGRTVTVIPDITCNHFFICELSHSYTNFVSLATSTLASSAGQLAVRGTDNFFPVSAGNLPAAM